MENASDALIMSANVLIFVIALTVCISSFSMFREDIDNLLDETEVVQMAKNGDVYLNYMDSKNNDAIRVVGAETVISSMVRSIKENYVVYIKLKDNGDIFDETSDPDKKTVDRHTAEKDLTLKTGETVIRAGDEIIKTTIGNRTNQDINAKLKNKLYDKLVQDNKKFYEYLGEYVDNTSVNIEEKTVYRVITYIEKEKE